MSGSLNSKNFKKESKATTETEYTTLFCEPTEQAIGLEPQHDDANSAKDKIKTKDLLYFTLRYYKATANTECTTPSFDPNENEIDPELQHDGVKSTEDELKVTETEWKDEIESPTSSKPQDQEKSKGENLDKDIKSKDETESKNSFPEMTKNSIKKPTENNLDIETNKKTESQPIADFKPLQDDNKESIGSSIANTSDTSKGLTLSYEESSSDEENALCRRKAFAKESNKYDSIAQRTLGQTISWPKFFADLVTMLEYSTLMYSINEIRDAARKGEIENIEDVFKTPIKFSELIDLLMTHHDEIFKNMPANLLYLLEPLENKIIRDSVTITGGSGRRGMQSCSRRRTNRGAGCSLNSPISIAVSNRPNSNTVTQCVVYSDHNHKNELVYGIFLDSIKESIIVSFRGTTTSNDIMMDLDSSVKTLENPIRHVEGQPETLLIFRGFYKYLFAKKGVIKEASNRHLNYNKNVETKFDEVKQTVIELQKKYPNFAIYVTGHSLGGALATLFSFFISVESDDVIRKPISCVSFASPKTGNWDFARAFRHQELSGKLRHLRVHNHRDPIPPLPPLLFPFAFQRSKLYRHVGISLLLKKNTGHYRIVLKPLVKEGGGGISPDWMKATVNTMFCFFTVFVLPNLAIFHSLDEYSKRVKGCEPLKDTTTFSCNENLNCQKTGYWVRKKKYTSKFFKHLIMG